MTKERIKELREKYPYTNIGTGLDVHGCLDAIEQRDRRIAELVIEAMKHDGDMADLFVQIEGFVAAMNALQSELSKAGARCEAIAMYARHDCGCYFQVNPFAAPEIGVCACGLNELLNGE